MTIAQGVLQPGQTFAGDFRVSRCVARGGMGEVYEVQQLSTGHHRALKVMREEHAQNPDLRARFTQEARVGSSIASPHVVEVIAAGIDRETGLPWLAMEYLDGVDLATALGTRGALSRRDTLDLFRQLCHAVGAGHKVGLVHRDLKPENVFLCHSDDADTLGFVKVLDYGIARWADSSGGPSPPTAPIGTWHWAAPEQATPGKVGPEADVWALGLLAFRVLTGRTFWRTVQVSSYSRTALMKELLTDPIPAAHERAQEYGCAALLPPGFDAWFVRCVCRDVGARFATADLAFEAFRPLLRTRQVVRPPGMVRRVLTGCVLLAAGGVAVKVWESESIQGMAHGTSGQIASVAETHSQPDGGRRERSVQLPPRTDRLPTAPLVVERAAIPIVPVDGPSTEDALIAPVGLTRCDLKTGSANWVPGCWPPPAKVQCGQKDEDNLHWLGKMRRQKLLLDENYVAVGSSIASGRMVFVCAYEGQHLLVMDVEHSSTRGYVSPDSVCVFSHDPAQAVTYGIFAPNECP